MKIKYLAVSAAVLGSLLIVYAFWVQDVSVPLLAGIPATGGAFDEKFFWRPLGAGIIFWTLAGAGFFWHHRRPGPARRGHESSVKH